MKKNFRKSVLAVWIAVGITLTAQAESLFPAAFVYEDQFVDVQTTDWFYSNVAALYSLGLTNGKGDGSHFDPNSPMTVAEVATMAARMRSLYDFGDSEMGAELFQGGEGAWYDPYVAYLCYVGVLGKEFDGHMELPATRAEVAHILANTLPEEVFDNINQDAVAEGYATGQYIRDVSDYTPYREDILALYRRGVLNGMDSAGSFHPGATIRRSEAAAIITRMVDEDLRIKLQWEIYEAEPVTYLAELVESDGTFFSAPKADDAAAIDADIRYMLSQGQRTLALDYGEPLPETEVTALMEAFLAAVRRYPEQTYNQIHVSYNLHNGKISMRFSSSLYGENMLELYRKNILSAALIAREQLYAEGKLRTGMSQYEKAKAYFNWLCNSCEYDFECGDGDLGHSAYGAFYKHKAVCDGYTAAYNLLLRLEGIECSAIDVEEWDHMWTVAVLDGVSYHIDVTWGDQTGTPASDYFAMTEERSFARFRG